MFQVEEREGQGSHWELVKMGNNILTPVQRIPTKKAAVEIAKQYVSELNFDNALTADEKVKSFDAYLMDDNGVFLGNLDGKDVYLKDKDSVVKDVNYYMLSDKVEVRVSER